MVSFWLVDVTAFIMWNCNTEADDRKQFPNIPLQTTRVPLHSPVERQILLLLPTSLKCLLMQANSTFPPKVVLVSLTFLPWRGSCRLPQSTTKIWYWKGCKTYYILHEQVLIYYLLPRKYHFIALLPLQIGTGLFHVLFFKHCKTTLPSISKPSSHMNHTFCPMEKSFPIRFPCLGDFGLLHLLVAKIIVKSIASS